MIVLKLSCYILKVIEVQDIIEKVTYTGYFSQDIPFKSIFLWIFIFRLIFIGC